MARTLSSQRIERRPLDREARFRNLLAAVFMRAIYDLDDRTYCQAAEAWLDSPRVKELALLLDIELPSVATIRLMRKSAPKDEEEE